MRHSARSSAAVAALKHRVFGVGFLVLLVFFGWLTYAIFDKTFTDFEMVTLQSRKAGLQLPDNADVKIRGVIVGEVRGARTADASDGVELDLGLYPDAMGIIPANVSAMIVPKTLFGEKFVSLRVPESPASERIAAGDVIEESEVAIEVERVLSDIYPLLRTVQPAEINYTLTAIATALEGRGEEIGENLEVLDSYLRRMNPRIPLLVDDLKKLGAVSEMYRDVVPELADVLRNGVRTGRTFVEQEAKIEALFGDVASFSSTSRDFLERNGQNIIRLAEQGQRQLPVFEKYAPEYPCLVNGIVDVLPRQEEAFRNYTLHINLETLPRQPRGYHAGDAPAYLDKRGPVDVDDCEAAMAGRWHQHDLPPARLFPKLKTGVDYPIAKRPAPRIDLSSGFAGTAAEGQLVRSLAAPVLDTSADDVPDVATLLFGPIARGTEVSLR
jgi:phospholipid/cholesterol/gamma-HCH transport system substrate-binding protein